MTDRLLRPTAVHFGDHLRRGVDASPKAVVALGLLAVAVALPDAVGGVAVHLAAAVERDLPYDSPCSAAVASGRVSGHSREHISRTAESISRSRSSTS